MKFRSSDQPVYTVVLSKTDSNENKEIHDWLLSSLNGQVMMIKTAGGGYIETLSKPAQEKNHFGDINPFAKNNVSYQTMIMFTDQVDLTAFLLKFENSVD